MPKNSCDDIIRSDCWSRLEEAHTSLYPFGPSSAQHNLRVMTAKEIVIKRALLLHMTLLMENKRGENMLFPGLHFLSLLLNQYIVIVTSLEDDRQEAGLIYGYPLIENASLHMFAVQTVK